MASRTRWGCSFEARSEALDMAGIDADRIIGSALENNGPRRARIIQRGSILEKRLAGVRRPQRTTEEEIFGARGNKIVII
jgi:hypothetical protein